MFVFVHELLGGTKGCGCMALQPEGPSSLRVTPCVCAPIVFCHGGIASTATVSAKRARCALDVGLTAQPWHTLYALSGSTCRVCGHVATSCSYDCRCGCRDSWSPGAQQQLLPKWLAVAAVKAAGSAAVAAMLAAALSQPSRQQHCRSRAGSAAVAAELAAALLQPYSRV